ncbi:hypothetical protein KUTeg_013151 [Tegillarca granosa]|uniref:Uncharacterized protein n=1 Tax=Tegillarca granosa TaxID=220873 RepID=A0ABQ9EXC9_TEGGR|nr:hypothetical protein KUTeg_013151 [Tegillarca granosa]
MAGQVHTVGPRGKPVMSQQFAERLFRHGRQRILQYKTTDSSIYLNLQIKSISIFSLVLINFKYTHSNLLAKEIITYIVPESSRLHPVIPRLYVPEWKTDMKNRELIIKKREQMKYNVEDRNRVESKYCMPHRSTLLRPEFHHETSKYQSELMVRRDQDILCLLISLIHANMLCYNNINNLNTGLSALGGLANM